MCFNKKNQYYQIDKLPQKILIAEDNEDLAEQYFQVLTGRGHDVTITKDGEECIRKYRGELHSGNLKNSFPYDLVIVDYLMPIKDGATLVSEILDERPGQRIIFVTANKNEVIRNFHKIRKGVELFEKPFHMQKLIDAIESKVHKIPKKDLVMKGFRKWDKSSGISETAGPGPSSNNTPTRGYEKIKL